MSRSIINDGARNTIERNRMCAIESILHLKTLCGGIAGDNKEEGAKRWNIEDRTLDARD